MQPFTFTNATADWQRFTQEAAKWKPSGFDEEMSTRLTYYLDQQLPDTRRELERRFPETHGEMIAQTLPVTRHFIREQARVFLDSTKLDLVRKDDAELDPKVKTWWDQAKESMGLGLRLKKVDAYTTLMRTAGLRLAFANGRFTAQVVFPQRLRVVLDPDAPMNLDRAYGVALEIASEAGLASGVQRWEFWSAREGGGEKPQHLIIEEADGAVRVVDRDAGDALRNEDGWAVVPIVLFTAHTEELGLFTMEGSDLVPLNRGLNVLVTDIQHIAEQQGFGVMVVTAPDGSSAPSKIVRSPNTAISLVGGTKAEFINANAPLSELIQLADSRIKQSAVLYGIPPGSVSIEARAVASGVALQIERLPLLELRTDAVEVYRDPMRRVWTVFRALADAYAGEDGIEAIPEGTEMRWTPGDIQFPTDDQSRVDNLLARLKAKLISRLEAIAEDRGVSLEEAAEIAKRIDDELASDPSASEEDLLGLGSKKASLEPATPARGDEPAEPAAAPPAAPAAPTGTKAATVDALAVDPTTALNGAQVSALLEVVGQAARGEIPRATALEIIVAAFPVTRDQAEKILGPVGTTAFTPAPEPGAASAPPAQPEPPPVPAE